MNRSIKIEIKESPKLLKRLYRHENDKRKAERLLFLYLLKTGQISSLLQGSELLMHHRHTLSDWLEKYEHGGIKALLLREKPGGNTPKVSLDLKDMLEEKLKSEGFSSYKEAHEFMQEHGYEYTYDAAVKYLKKHHDTRLKTARPQHIKQDPDARDDFKKTLVKSSKNISRQILKEKSASTFRMSPDLVE